MTPVLAALWLLTALVPACLGLGAALALRPGWALPMHRALVAMAGIGLLAALAAPLTGDAATLALPAGPPGLALALRLDPLAGVLLVIVLLPATAGAGFAMDGAAADAASEFPLATGLACLALLGAGPFMFLLAAVPLALLLARARAWPPPLAALALAGTPALVLHALLRLPPEATPPWFAAALLPPAAALALVGGWRAGQGATPRAVLVALSGVHLGLMLCGAGLAMLTRGADLVPLAGLAATAALLHLLHHAGFATLLLLSGASLARGAGTTLLDRMGGLMAPMPVSGCCLLAGAMAGALLPPGPGFASAWLLFQALFAAPRAGGLALGALLGVVAIALALAIALGAAALLRLLGATVLGRPRTPRATAAQEAARLPRAVLLTLVVLVVLPGLLPWLTVAVVAPATGFAPGPVLPLAIAGSPIGLIAPLAAALLLAAIAGFRWVLRRQVLRQGGAPGQRWLAPWNDGFAAPPPWLPFGEPETQLTAAAHASALAPAIPPATPPAIPRALAWPRLDAARQRLSAGIARLQARLVAPMSPPLAPATAARRAAIAIAAVLAALFLTMAAGA